MTKRIETLALLAKNLMNVSYDLCEAIELYSKGVDRTSLKCEQEAVELFEDVKKLFNDLGWDICVKEKLE
jgi:hypothetical protein